MRGTMHPQLDNNNCAVNWPATRPLGAKVLVSRCEWNGDMDFTDSSMMMLYSKDDYLAGLLAYINLTDLLSLSESPLLVFTTQSTYIIYQ